MISHYTLFVKIFNLFTSQAFAYRMQNMKGQRTANLGIEELWAPTGLSSAVRKRFWELEEGLKKLVLTETDGDHAAEKEP